MAIIVVPGQVAIGDPNPGGPSALSNSKNVLTKVVKLSSANFTTGGTNTMVAVLPADSTIIKMRTHVKTQLAGGSVSAATIAVGTASGGAQLSAAISVFGAAGVNADISPAVGIMQTYAIPYTGDIQVWVAGVATTGNPTSGEVYLIVEYVR
jgi:hypothetical protein